MKKIIKEKIKTFLPEKYMEIYRNIKPAFMFKNISFSQTGEDIIVEIILNTIGYTKNINYCDIGANSPWKLSNTAKFYFKNKRDYTGVLVEPDPFLAKFLKSKRKNDIIVNKGIKSQEEDLTELDFFIMDSKTLNTFSNEEASYYESLGYKVNEVKSVEVVDINSLFESYFINKQIHFLSIDVEGLDYQILKSLDFKRFKPICICIETINFVTEGMAQKDDRIINFLLSNGYFEYAFTGINSIFVNKQMWLNR